MCLFIFIFILYLNYEKINNKIKNFILCEPDFPHLFINKTLKSNVDILQIISEINTLLPQLANFINQFNDLISESGINVITDSTGNMSIYVPQSMSNSAANNISTRVGVIDRLITTRGQEINDLLQKGLDIERNIKIENPNYTSDLTNKILEFKRLNALYKH